MSLNYSITKTFGFEASHKLNLDYTSPCAKFHGHSYKVEITIKSVKLDTNGMVMDFSELKPIKQWVDENWDHATIMSRSDPDVSKYKDDKNFKIYLSEFENITAELMCKELLIVIEQFFETIKDLVLKYINEIQISIWETVNNKATIIKTY